MRTFHFRLVPFTATLLLVIMGCSLSYWQTQRAHEKELIEAKLRLRENAPAIPFTGEVDIKKMDYSRVMLRGEFDSHWPIYLDNRPMNGMVGITVVMPFKLENQDKYIMVARGWVPRNNRNRSAIKQFDTPAGIVQIEGILKAHSGHVFQFGQATPLLPGALIQNLEIDAFIKASKLPTFSYIIEQTNEQKDGLFRNWPRASSGSDRNRGYAFQWLALALTTLVFFLATSVKKNEEKSDRYSEQ